MKQMTNTAGVSLPLAVWLAADGYDFSPNRKSISATSIMKPVRQILLKERLTPETFEIPDVKDFIASRLGHTIHDGIEKAWKNDYAPSLRKLGYPEKVIQRIKVNPETMDADDIPIWLEQRTERDILGYTISGKFDMVLEGELQDFKSTSVYSWIMGNKDEDYMLQGSIYRWLNPDKITGDYISIQFIFTDWSKAASRQQSNYPSERVMEHRVELMSLESTENWLASKIRELEKYADAPENEIPECSDKDLWRSDPVYKYYSDPSKTSGRSTKNFPTSHEASAYKASKGKGKGVVIHVPGQVKACGYCPSFNACTQKDNYDHA